MNRDYRVKVRVEFTVDVGTRDSLAALRSAERITEQVFKADYGRAENVVIDIVGIDAVTHEPSNR